MRDDDGSDLCEPVIELRQGSEQIRLFAVVLQNAALTLQQLSVFQKRRGVAGTKLAKCVVNQTSARQTPALQNQQIRREARQRFSASRRLRKAAAGAFR